MKISATKTARIADVEVSVSVRCRIPRGTTAEILVNDLCKHHALQFARGVKEKIDNLERDLDSLPTKPQPQPET